MSKKINAASTEVVSNEVVAETNAVVVESIPHNYGDMIAEHKTKSAVVRKLSAEGFKRGTIAKFCGIRYQHVRNILVTPLKKTDSVEA